MTTSEEENYFLLITQIKEIDFRVRDLDFRVKDKIRESKKVIHPIRHGGSSTRRTRHSEERYLSIKYLCL
jgi:hypothetical protein